MRKLLTILFIFICSTSFARFYYVSNTGNDANDGLTTATPWASIAKVNAAAATMAPGDQILFKCGGTFHGALVMKKSGNAANPIRIGSYSTGAKPILTGMITATGWTNLGGNIWEATATPTVKATVNIFTIDGTAVEIGRTPNAYTTYSSATTTTLNSSFFATASSYVGAEVVCKKSSFIIVRSRVTAQTTAGITYTPIAGLDNGGGLSPVNGSANFGFFMQRAASTLDVQNEWYFNPTTKKVRVYSTTNPSSFVTKISDIDTVLVLANTTNIIIENIAIEGAGSYGVESNLGGQITVQNCDFNNNTRAVYIWNSDDANVLNCSINNSFNNAILVSNNQKRRIIVNNNLITNTGQLIGIGAWNSNNNLKGIVVKTDSTRTSNYVLVSNNSVVNTGYMGIEFQGSNVYVSRNYVRTYCNTLDDGGAIYTFSSVATATKDYYNRHIDSNIVGGTIGSPDGTTRTVGDVVGLYIDDNSMNITLTNNTVDSILGPGIQINSTKNVIVAGNTFYNCDISVNINKKANCFLSNNRITQGNIIYQKNASQVNLFYTDADLSYPTAKTITQSVQSMAVIDSNYITNQKTAGYRIWYGASGTVNQFPADAQLSVWRLTYAHDVISTLPPIAVNPANTILATNPTDTVLVYRFAGLRKMTPDGVAHDNLINIPRWGSAVLIANGSVPAGNIPPVANAGPDQDITLPTSTATFAGSATDADGTISSHVWTKVSGPAGGTITTPSSYTSGVTALQPGLYLFQLKATDNSSDTAIDVMQITVHAANIPPTVNGGGDKIVQLPATTTTLTATANDVDGTISTVSWTKISGPTGGTIASPSTLNTGLSALQEGTYQYQVQVTDNNGATAIATVQVIVKPVIPPANVNPIASAGNDTTVVLPSTTANLRGSGTDQDGTIVSYSWLKISGPTGGVITSASSQNTSVTALQQGFYTYQLTVTDNNGGTGTDLMVITVNAANQLPLVSILSVGPIELPDNFATLTGSATDNDGTISSYQWIQVSGPTTATIVSPNSATTDVQSLQQGAYVFQLTATDNSGGQGSAVVTITVNAAPPNESPTASAGRDTILVLPLGANYTLIGTGADAEGSVTYGWTKLSAPVGDASVITSPTSASTGLTGLIAGVYQFTLTVTDGDGAQATDTVQVTVSPEPVVPIGGVILRARL